MSELNKKNVLICKQIFDINNDYKLNIYNGDSLKADFNKEFGIKEFDIIIGNPPYNKDTSKNKAKGQILWPEFIKKSYNIIKKNGYIVFIHPPNYRKPLHELQKIFFENQITFIKIFNDNQSNKYFHCKTRVDYYILQKKPNYTKTIINDETDVIYNINITSNTKYISNYGISIHEKLQNYKSNKIKCINPRSHDTTRKYVQKNKDKEYIYKLFNTSNASNITYYYSTKKHPYQNNKKVIFSNGRYIYPIYDNGNLGGTQSSLMIFVDSKNDGIKMLKYINSKLFKFIIKSTKFSNFGISHELISNIPNIIDKYENENDMSDENIYKLFKLTKNEIEIINNNVK
jgi:hypothetical protein